MIATVAALPCYDVLYTTAAGGRMTNAGFSAWAEDYLVDLGIRRTQKALKRLQQLDIRSIDYGLGIHLVLLDCGYSRQSGSCLV